MIAGPNITITEEGMITYFSKALGYKITTWPINITWADQGSFSDGEWNLIRSLGKRK